MKKNKNKFLFILSILLLPILAISALSGCSMFDSSTSSNSSTNVTQVTDETITAKETISDFSIITSDGNYSVTDNIYTISKAGTYSLSGALNGQILISVADDEEVDLELKGVTITYSNDSPIKVLSADKVEISSKKNTDNVIKDMRNTKTLDDDNQGEGAISAKCDLKLKGQGTLVVIGNYNNGIHTTKDLEIKNLSLKVMAYNNAIKGKDSVTIDSGTIVAISTNGDGIETTNTDLNKNGETRGDIVLTGGTITVYAAGDGFQSAHNFEMSKDETNNTTPTVTIYTGSYSGYTASDATTTSYKGVKVQNQLNIFDGTIILKTYDDGLHADYGTNFEDGTKGLGTINISGGTVTTNVYAPTQKTAGGEYGPRGWNNQQTVTGADALHADYKLNISGGTIYVDSSYEGLEANIITISGGTCYISATDDGINACKLSALSSSTPQIIITGGYVDVSVSSNGDTDGIDSNGIYIQSGGVVIARGPNSTMAAALDTDGTAKITGGTIIVLGSLGERGLTRSSGVGSYNLSLHSIGNHTIKINGVSYTFKNNYSYSKTLCYSSESISA